MNVVGRYVRVRGLGAGGWQGPPYVLDLHKARFMPVERGSHEWWRSPSGAWWWYDDVAGVFIPAVSGGAGIAAPAASSYNLQLPCATWGNATFDSTNLSSAYTAGSAGAACTMRYPCPASRTVTDIYFFLAPYGGTAANVTSIGYEVRSGTLATPTTTGGALLGSGTVNPASATGWIHVSGLSIAISAGYTWFIICDPAGDGHNYATDYAVCTRSENEGLDGRINWSWLIFSTTDGFATAPSISSNRSPVMVICFSSGKPIGKSITSQSGGTSNTNRKGLVFGGLVAPLKIYAVLSERSSDTPFTGVEIYPKSSTPGTDALLTATQVVATTATANAQGAIFPAFTFDAATDYRVVLTVGGANRYPNKMNVGAGVDDNLRDAKGFGDRNWYYAEANGTSNWSNDDSNAYPQMVIYPEDQVEAAAGGVPMSRVFAGM